MAFFLLVFLQSSVLVVFAFFSYDVIVVPKKFQILQSRLICCEDWIFWFRVTIIGTWSVPLSFSFLLSIFAMTSEYMKA